MTENIASTVYSFALGDAWGYVTEFDNFEHNMATQPPPPNPLVVSDDTQMGIYTLQAIFDTDADLSRVHENVDDQNIMRKDFADQYVKFYYDEDNNRAPGMTCMSAIREYIESPVKETGLEGLSNMSLGCGTIMRTPWIGLLPLERRTMVALSVLHSQTTHGDPAGWIASAIATLMTHDLLNKNVELGEMPLFDHALSIVREIEKMDLNILSPHEHGESFWHLVHQMTNFHRNWFSSPVSGSTITDYLADSDYDVNDTFGKGWIATEALYNALGVVSYHNSAEEAWHGVQRLVYSTGDSDSTAAIAGAFYGAYYGDSWHEVDVASRLEPRYAKELEELILNIRSFVFKDM